jgi:hypothetical protein
VSSSRLRRRGRSAFVAVFAVVLALALTSSAQAYTQHHYWHGLLEPYSWGGLGYFSSEQMVGSIASYPGREMIPVCEAVYDYSLGRFVHSSCGTSAAGQVNNVQSYYGDLLSAQVENGSSYTHTIDGFAYTP